MSLRPLIAVLPVLGLLLASAASAQTITYSALSGSPQIYDEQGVRHINYYNSFGNAGHWHSQSGDYIWGHDNCCSNLGRMYMINGSTFGVTQLTRRMGGGTTWTAYNASGGSIGSVTITGSSGIYTFPTSWQSGLSRIDMQFNNGNFGWDNLVISTCSTTTANAGGPYTVPEGGTVTLNGTSTPVNATKNWDFTGNGSYTDASGASPTFNAGTSTGSPLNGPGSVSVGLQTTCPAGGGSDTDTATINITNAPPAVSATVPATGDEGTAVSVTATATDPGGDPVTWLWDFGDGNQATTQSASNTYADDGTYTVTLTVTDDLGAATTVTNTIVIANLPPSADSVTGPSTGDEGQALSFAAVGSDPGPVDAAALTWTWDWNDGTTDTGANPTKTWADEGIYNVTATVTDPQGASDSEYISVVIGNLPPTITTTPGTTADEAVLYTYAPAATDPGTADVLSWSLDPGAPASMTINSVTGEIAWTPTWAEGGPNTVTITVDDGDGGSDSQTWTIDVTMLDTDGDGMPDLWEIDNGLDELDPADAAEDPDGDGLDNLDEFLGGTDPNQFDGPSVPVLVAPVNAAEVAALRPTLMWNNSVDPQGDPLTYDVEVYSDAAGTTLVTSGTNLSPGSGQTVWELDTDLQENGAYWWRAQAYDPYVGSGWADLEEFFVSAVNEPPPAPTPLYPVDGEIAASPQPVLDWNEVVDPDRDAVSYDVRLWNADGSALLSTGSVALGSRDTIWGVDIVLEEDTWYRWDVRAVDEHGLEGDWSDPAPFVMSTDNSAPGPVVWVNPTDGGSVDSVSPTAICTETRDDEGQPLRYHYLFDTANSFDSGDLVEGTVPGAGDGQAPWDLAEDGVELTENTWYFGRVRAEDPQDIGGPWAEITFFVRGPNDPPTVPVLVAPESEADALEDVNFLVILHSTDPEGDAITYDFRVADDEGMTTVLAEVSGVAPGAGDFGDELKTSWPLELVLNERLYWTARAVDEHGAESDWAEPWVLDLDNLPPPVIDDDVVDCSCDNSLVGGVDAVPGGLLLALALMAPAARRRR